jgi:hypothetical protein
MGYIRNLNAKRSIVIIRPIQTILLVTYILVSLESTILFAEIQPNWQERGESWASSFENGVLSSNDGAVYEVTKEGIKKISHQKLAENLTLYGRVQLADVHMAKNFTCYGFAEVSNTTVHGVTTMYGPMNAHRCLFADLDIRCANEILDEPGIVNLSHSSARKLFINGKLMTESCTVKSITTFFHELEMSHSHVGDITMMNGSQLKKRKAVIVLNNTIVEGSIQFSQKGGTVICKGSSVVKGEILGGTLEKIS